MDRAAIETFAETFRGATDVCDPLATVLAVKPDGPLRLYRGSGHAIQEQLGL